MTQKKLNLTLKFQFINHQESHSCIFHIIHQQPKLQPLQQHQQLQSQLFTKQQLHKSPTFTPHLFTIHPQPPKLATNNQQLQSHSTRLHPIFNHHLQTTFPLLHTSLRVYPQVHLSLDLHPHTSVPQRPTPTSPLHPTPSALPPNLHMTLPATSPLTSPSP